MWFHMTQHQQSQSVQAFMSQVLCVTQLLSEWQVSWVITFQYLCGLKENHVKKKWKLFNIIIIIIIIIIYKDFCMFLTLLSEGEMQITTHNICSKLKTSQSRAKVIKCLFQTTTNRMQQI